MTTIDVCGLTGAAQVGPEQIDTAWALACLDKPEPASVEIDLSGATGLRQDVLLYIVAVVARRHGLEMDTFFRFPALKPGGRSAAVGYHEKRPFAIRDFLAAWEFPAALTRVTGMPIENFLVEQQRTYFNGAAPPKYLQFGGPDAGIESEIKTSFFSLTHLELGNEDEDSSVVDHGDASPRAEDDEAETPTGHELVADRFRGSWTDNQILSVLELHLEHTGDIGHVVIYEALLNAADHPSATHAYVSSQLAAGPHAELHEEGELIVCVWDDGMPVADTLADAEEIHSPAYQKVTSVFEVTIAGGAEEQMNFAAGTYTSDELPPDVREALVIAAFCLGVSSRPGGKRAGTSNRNYPDVAKELQEHAGIGLYQFMRTVLETFHGSISYMSGSDRYYLRNIDNPDSPAEYAIELDPAPITGPLVQGNLLVARLAAKKGRPGSQHDSNTNSEASPIFA